MKSSLRKKLGQNTAEYLIMLVLVAIGSIGIFSVFGDTLKKQVKNVIVAMQGQGTVETIDNTEQAKNQVEAGTGMDVRQDQITRFGETN